MNMLLLLQPSVVAGEYQFEREEVVDNHNGNSAYNSGRSVYVNVIEEIFQR